LFFVRAAVLVNFHWSGQFSPEGVYTHRVRSQQYIVVSIHTLIYRVLSVRTISILS
jgi:hypothetical protein